MNQKISLQAGKRRHVSRNTVTLSRLKSGVDITPRLKGIDYNDKEKLLSHSATKAERSGLRKLFGKIAKRFFGKNEGY